MNCLDTTLQKEAILPSPSSEAAVLGVCFRETWDLSLPTPLRGIWNAHLGGCLGWQRTGEENKSSSPDYCSSSFAQFSAKNN